ncbi:unnamed protein product, partial [Prorocentrum cordatum]
VSAYFFRPTCGSSPSFPAPRPPSLLCGWGTELVASAASAAPEPEPRRSWEAGGDVDLDSVAYGFMASQALFAALELGLFDHVAAAGPAGAGAAALGAACGVEGPRLLTLLTALVALKCLRQAGGFYTLSPNTARYMVRTSKAYYGDYLMYQIGRQFYATMGQLPEVMKTGRALTYASWFSDPAVAETYTRAQHNGSLATARSLIRGMADLAEVRDLLDVGGGSGAFSYAFAAAAPALQATVLELPEVCCVGEAIRAGQPEDVRRRVRFVELDATSPSWPVADGAYDAVIMSYLSGSVPEPVIVGLYANAWRALRPGGRLLVHDFMVNDSRDGPVLASLWALQHVTVNAAGVGLCPSEVLVRLGQAGFDPGKCDTSEMIQGLTKLVVARKAPGASQ